MSQEEREDFFKNYEKARAMEAEQELNENRELIESFIDYARSFGVQLIESNVEYVPTTGIIASAPGLLQALHPELNFDKDGLVNFYLLTSLFRREFFGKGLLYTSNHIVMAHTYFRRSYHEWNAFAPRFIEYFWSLGDPKIIPSIALDMNRVRINVDNSGYMELDTWYGAKFNKNVANIPDGIVKLAPPPDLENYLDLIFGEVYSLDIKWSTKEQLRNFQAEEFKIASRKIVVDGKEYHPVRYIHSEFDQVTGLCKHLDGAIHFYQPDDYFKRRDSDFNYNSKNEKQIKGQSIKLFRMDGSFSVETWIDFVSHFLTGNPLVSEYFEGKFPVEIQNIIERVRKKNT